MPIVSAICLVIALGILFVHVTVPWWERLEDSTTLALLNRAEAELKKMTFTSHFKDDVLIMRHRSDYTCSFCGVANLFHWVEQ